MEEGLCGVRCLQWWWGRGRGSGATGRELMGSRSARLGMDWLLALVLGMVPWPRSWLLRGL